MAQDKTCGKDKLFTQEEVNKIIAVRLKREHDQFSKQMTINLDQSLIRLSEHLQQEIYAIQRSIHTETNDALSSKN